MKRNGSRTPVDLTSDPAVLLELSRGQRETSDPHVMLHAACAALGKQISVDSVGFFETDVQTLSFITGWSDGALLPLTGQSAAAFIGTAYLAEVVAGRTLSIADTRLDPRTAGSIFVVRGGASMVSMPIMRAGSWRAGLYINHGVTRKWTVGELRLVRAVADQTWDAVERARAVGALAESQARLLAITNSIDQMLWAALPNGHHDFFNQRWYEFTGAPVGSTDGDGWSTMFHADDQKRAWGTWRASLATGEPYHIEYRLRHHSGNYHWVLGRAQPARDNSGHITRWYGSCTDIDEIVQAREVLARSRDELARIVEERTLERDRAWKFAQDLQAVVDLNGTFKAANDAWHNILGWQPEELIGRHHLDFNHPEHREASQQALDEAAAPRPRAYETRCRHKDGTYRWIAWVTAVEGGLIYASGRDVTAEKATAQALETTREALRQSQKMETMGQITGGIAHDFNNLLQAASGSLELIRRKPDDANKVRAWAAQGAEAIGRGAKLTGQLLAFSRLQELEFKPLNLAVLIMGLKDLLMRSAGPTVRVHLDLQAAELNVLGDETQIEMALLNLAVNARDAMPTGGELTIAASRRFMVACDEIPAGDCVLLNVTDNGIGMPPETAARAFDPFFTTKEVGRGTGLGLSQVYGMIRQAGGAVRLESRINVGTIVSMQFPCVGAVAVVNRDIIKQTQDPQFGMKVLIVDDDPGVRRFLADALEALGYTSVEAEDGFAGIAALATVQPDVMIVDFAMPGMTGADVAREARARCPALPIIFASGFADTQAIQSVPGLAAPMLRKPFRIAELEAVLEAVLRETIADASKDVESPPRFNQDRLPQVREIAHIGTNGIAASSMNEKTDEKLQTATQRVQDLD